jgi:hypothetical protein
MRWKEYLHHEGTGKRIQEEWQEAQKMYGAEQQRLIAQLQARQEEAISRWKGLTREKALGRWRTMDVKAYERECMNYAFQKDRWIADGLPQEIMWIEDINHRVALSHRGVNGSLNSLNSLSDVAEFRPRICFRSTIEY